LKLSNKTTWDTRTEVHKGFCPWCPRIPEVCIYKANENFSKESKKMEMNKRIEIHTTAYQRLMKGFDTMIIAKGYRQTGKTYQNNVKEFLSYLESQGIVSVKKIRAVDMVSYYEYITSRPAFRGVGLLKSSTISGKMFSVDLFFDYLLDTKLLTSKIILPRHKRSESTQRNTATVEEILMICGVCESKRDKVILSLAYGCGLRRREMQDLNTNDLQFQQNVLRDTTCAFNCK
jgi:integrase/recombinase XerD